MNDVMDFYIITFLLLTHITHYLHYGNNISIWASLKTMSSYLEPNIFSFPLSVNMSAIIYENKECKFCDLR